MFHTRDWLLDQVEAFVRALVQRRDETRDELPVDPDTLAAAAGLSVSTAASLSPGTLLMLLRDHHGDLDARRTLTLGVALAATPGTAPKARLLLEAALEANPTLITPDTLLLLERLAVSSH